MGPIWGRDDTGGPHVGPMNFAIWVHEKNNYIIAEHAIYVKKDYFFGAIILMTAHCHKGMKLINNLVSGYTRNPNYIIAEYTIYVNKDYFISTIILMTVHCQIGMKLSNHININTHAGCRGSARCYVTYAANCGYKACYLRLMHIATPTSGLVEFMQ